MRKSTAQPLPGECEHRLSSPDGVATRHRRRPRRPNSRISPISNRSRSPEGPKTGHRPPCQNPSVDRLLWLALARPPGLLTGPEHCADPARFLSGLPPPPVQPYRTAPDPCLCGFGGSVSIVPNSCRLSESHALPGSWAAGGTITILFLHTGRTHLADTTLSLSVADPAGSCEVALRNIDLKNMSQDTPRDDGLPARLSGWRVKPHASPELPEPGQANFLDRGL